MWDSGMKSDTFTSDIGLNEECILNLLLFNVCSAAIKKL